MQPPVLETNNLIPNYHFENLKQIESGYWWYEGRIIWAKELLQSWLELNKCETNEIRYADLGCGTGGFGVSISEFLHPKETALIDFNSEVLSKIKCSKEIKIHPMDLSKEFHLPFKPNLITCMDVIEHIKDDATFLERISSQLAPGGLLLISAPAHQILYSKWDQSLGHYRRFSSADLKQKVKNSGLNIVRVHHAWSFLFFLAFYRHLSPKKQIQLQYPKVSLPINKLLTQAAYLESKLASKFSFPFGTSIFLTAIKPC